MNTSHTFSKLITKIILFSVINFLNCSINLFSQETERIDPVVKLSGYVKSDFFFDTRQTICAREGHFLLFPSPRENDNENRDINEKSSFNMLPVQSNLAIRSSGYSVKGMSLSALIEGDFFGQSNSDVNMFRLRHAYIKLHWEKTELLIGQYWHPLFATSCYPGTVSFNTGAPIQPFSRAPQIRISYKTGIATVSGTMLSQRDYVSVGPAGPSSKYLRDSGLPEIQFSGELNQKRNSEFILGAGFGFKKLVPQLKTGRNIKTAEAVNGITANAYFKHVSKFLTIKLEGIYLENGSEFLSISGFAVKDSLDVEKGTVNYEAVRTLSYWGELQTMGKKVQIGIFSGFTENLGTKSSVEGPFYLTSNAMIKNLYRISPRLTVTPGNLTLAAEIEYTSALYGKPDDNGIMNDVYRVSNVRFLLSSIYRF